MNPVVKQPDCLFYGFAPWRGSIFSFVDAHKFIWSRSFYTQKFAPVFDVESPIVDDDILICPSVFALNFWRSPNAILGAIVSIVIDAFHGITASRFFTHIRIEVFKRVQPSFANFDSTTAMRMVFVIFGIVASSFKIAPRLIFQALAQIMSAILTISAKQISGSFASQASTASRRFSEIGCRNYSPSAAIALASPHSVFVPRPWWRAIHYNKASESFTLQFQRKPAVRHNAATFLADAKTIHDLG